ncbi:hypothetical protein E2C01_018992 [Portunus trituberculatus]|uniref:Uncharacterized protein n=1 Tax=Portunus trituberculatus TaxID=210409 RepID=A0A5B7DXP3_PORTR|nr:hypothetical protein [Portunus trituberculatus]
MPVPLRKNRVEEIEIEKMNIVPERATVDVVDDHQQEQHAERTAMDPTSPMSDQEAEDVALSTWTTHHIGGKQNVILSIKSVNLPVPTQVNPSMSRVKDKFDGHTAVVRTVACRENVGKLLNQEIHL